MCGIAGFLVEAGSGSNGGDASQAAVVRMTSTLTPRGPDACGHVVLHRVAFGHRRLSIMDLSDNGAQPMQLADGGALITYNGEVYNFLELRRQLEALGRQFRGHSDTEVILHAYDQWGLEGLKRLEGIFAFALWDPPRERFVLVRDRLGIKPLYFGASAMGLAFGSEIKAVLAAGGVDARLDDQAFREYLWYGNTHEERTFYRGVRQLLPGHWLIHERGQSRVEPWWRIEDWLRRASAPTCFEEAVSLVRDRLDAAVRRQLTADVPVSLFLSGGLDSAAIAAAARACGAAPTSYTATFDFAGGVHELAKARQVADHLGLQHHEIPITATGLAATLEHLARAHDEPFADAANIPLYLMARALGQRAKVVLQGDGGDELFAGYRRYALLQNARWWRLWPHALSPLVRRAGGHGRRLTRIATTMGTADTALRMAGLLTVETAEAPPEQLLTAERRRSLEEGTDPFRAYRRAADRFRAHDPVQQMLLTDLTVQLPSQFLPKVDRATMAAGLEARVPLLDEKIAEVVVGMPSSWKVRGLEKKALLRATLRGRIPDAILDGPKTGFGVPYAHWLRSTLHEYARERLTDPAFLARFDLRGRAVETMLERHRDGAGQHGFMLWKLLQLAIWAGRQDGAS